MLSLSCIVEGFLTTHARIQALGVSLRSRRVFWQAILVFFLDRAKPETPVPKPHIRTRHSSPCLKAGAFWLGSVNQASLSRENPLIGNAPARVVRSACEE
jgi:hypothetical protein